MSKASNLKSRIGPYGDAIVELAIETLPKGKCSVRFDFAYDGGGKGKGDTGTLSGFGLTPSSSGRASPFAWITPDRIVSRASLLPPADA